MATLTLKTASRFNRATPSFANDPKVVEAISKLAEKADVKKAADDLVKTVTNVSERKYVNIELQKRFSFPNNIKLMLANETIYHALLNSCLKGGKELDLDDLDYINVNLREKAKEYNKVLVDAYTNLVLIEKGKAYKEEIKDAATLRKEILDLKDNVKDLEKNLVNAEKTEQQLKKEIEAAQNNEKQLKEELFDAYDSISQLKNDLGDAAETIRKLEDRLAGSEGMWNFVLEIAGNGKITPEILKGLRELIERRKAHLNKNM